MQAGVSSRKGKRDLATLDLLGGCANLHCSLDLNLLPEDGHEPPPARPLLGNQSLCTIDRVKRALERAAQRDSHAGQEAQPQKPPSTDVVVSPSPASSPSSSSSSSSSVTTAPSMKRRRTAAATDEESDGCDDTGAAVLVAAGCPACLSFVLTAKGNPRCPRCQSRVQPTAVPPQERRPGIDLNCALQSL